MNKWKYIIGQIVDEEGLRPLKPVSPLVVYKSRKEAQAAIQNMCLYNHRKTWEFVVIKVS